MLSHSFVMKSNVLIRYSNHNLTYFSSVTLSSVVIDIDKGIEWLT